MAKLASKHVHAFKAHGIPLKKTMIALCIGVIIQPVAWAQTEAETVDREAFTDLEEVTVVGVRSNIKTAQSIKRNADTFVDAISAKDINSLPDKSVLEAIQRLPGVSIERYASSNDADHFSVEGSGVVIRGLTQTRSEFNGRGAFAANTDNGISFQDIPPELVGLVRLVKNQTADMTEGGISGSIDLVTRKPFDSKETFGAFTAKAQYSDSIEKTTPSLSATYSTRWDSDAGEFGVLFSASGTNLKSRADGIQIYNFLPRSNDDTTGAPVNGTDDSLSFVPVAANLRRQDFDRDRVGAVLALQWRSPDEKTEALLEYIYSDSRVDWEERAIENPDQPFSVGSPQPINGSNFNFRPNANGLSLFESGVISGDAGSGGQRYLTYSRNNVEESTINDIALTLSHQVTERLLLKGGLQYTVADFEQFDISSMFNFRSDVALDLSGSIPSVEYLGDNGDLAPLTDGSTMYFRSAMDHAEDDEADGVALNLDFEFELDGNFFHGIKGGARLSEREKTIRESKYNWGAVSESWAGGVQSVDNFAAAGPNNVEEYTFDDFFDGAGLEGDATFLFPHIDLVQVENYDNFHDRIAPVNTANNWNSLGNRPNALPNSLFIPTEISVNKVESQALYGRIDFGSDDYSRRFSGNVGLRYVSYDWDLTGGVTFPNSAAGNLDRFFSAEDIAFSTGGLVPDNTTTDEFDALLPSFNIKVELNDDIIARFGASKAVSLPDLRDKRNSLTIGRQVNVVRDPITDQVVTAEIVGFSGGGGNPQLNPIESVNLDASLEWYFADTGSLTASVFHKDVEGFYRYGPTLIQATNNGVTRDVLINGPINGEDAVIKGFELAYTQFYDFLPAPFDGIGLQANYTYIDSNGSSSTEDALSPEGGRADSQLGVFSGLPLEGLSEDTFNLILMYEKGPISARIAYNYRSEYLLNTRDVITFVPNVSEATEQIDASIRYNISDRFTIGLEMNNLGDEVNELSQVFTPGLDQAPRSFFVNDKRYTLTLSGSF